MRGLARKRLPGGSDTMRVLLIEDDSAMAQSIDLMLKSEGFNVYSTDLGEEGVDLGKLYDYDIILLDLNLPDMSGFEVLKHLRVAKVQTPILILSGTSTIENKVKGLGVGADDYLTKPFRLPELLARLRASLRRGSGAIEEGPLQCGKIRLDPDRRMVQIDSQRVNLTPYEFAILLHLMRNEGRVVSHRQLLHSVWGESQPPEIHILRVHMSNLRKKLETHEGLPEYISNEPGIGYRLAAPGD